MADPIEAGTVAGRRSAEAEAGASRSVHVTLKNESRYVLSRSMLTVPDGNWSTLPPERVQPGTQVEV